MAWRILEPSNPGVAVAQRSHYVPVVKVTKPIKKVVTLAELRGMRRMSQEELANATGLRQSTISKLEHKPVPTLTQLRTYVDGLGGTVQVIVQFGSTSVEFVGGPEGPPPSR